MSVDVNTHRVDGHGHRAAESPDDVEHKSRTEECGQTDAADVDARPQGDFDSRMTATEQLLEWRRGRRDVFLKFVKLLLLLLFLLERGCILPRDVLCFRHGTPQPFHCSLELVLPICGPGRAQQACSRTPPVGRGTRGR